MYISRWCAGGGSANPPDILGGKQTAPDFTPCQQESRGPSIQNLSWQVENIEASIAHSAFDLVVKEASSSDHIVLHNCGARTMYVESLSGPSALILGTLSSVSLSISSS